MLWKLDQEWNDIRAVLFYLSECGQILSMLKKMMERLETTMDIESIPA